MPEKATITVDKDLASAAKMIQSLRDCGAVNTNDDLMCFADLFSKLKDEDKPFVFGMVQGAASALIAGYKAL